MLVGNIYILFIAPDFFGPFQGFLITLGVLLAAWSAVFLADMLLYRRRAGYDEHQLYSSAGRYGAVNLAGVLSFLVAGFIGLGLVESTAAVFSWTGYLLGLVGGEEGTVATSSIGLLIAFVVAGLLYALLAPRLSPERRMAAG
jgi:purine-cytosine permease-like protein